MYVRPTAPLSIGGVLDDAIRLYRNSFSRCWMLALAFSIVLGAFQIAFLLTILPAPGGQVTPQQLLAIFKSPALIGGYLVVVLLSLIFYGALFARESAVMRGDESFTAMQGLAAAMRRLPGMVLATLITLVAICAGLILLIVPGVYLWGKLQLWLAAMFADDVGGTAALGLSWRLTRGRWWRAFVIFMVALIILYVFTFAVGVIAGVLAAVSGHSTLVERQIATQLLSSASNVITAPAVPAVWLAMYHDFKLRSEGGDLAQRVGALGRA